MQTNSFRFELRNTPSRNGKFRILLTITVGGKRSRLATPIYVDAKTDFNSKCKNNNWIRKSVPESTVWNAELFDILENARRKFCDLNNDNNIAVTADKVIDRINAKDKSDSFISFMINEQKNIYNSGSLGVWKK